ncbi:hypothetical protein CBS63078_32 [Aspergillus niger]|uniref:Uncharacterized protein n=3 Tax=Aspergillus niger TaxID=5061 RepID=A2Q7Z7_ASPNC|nr:hypothetical protein An01g02510 [Aspergillus niger]XP_025449448.1 uncharacterized protein BO96DRAFT_192723 [Aspergillus niger CBS 101883]RDH19909.1 hypothetical protein M747DRAFT_50196 [Aspergillus niger ATCC 13496]KAI2821338.1 hypothetical protein CBS115989_3092 [Aspergillus niger]KAI2830043.1 hypothetical protein CBS133816_3916 [Aspergillus niger]KAI2846581.1 hypothetical protein CBS11350_3614 [Aspergillus niger]KAI2857179.1 hypothetical protein CBS11232_3255 [Aspergillus niger]|eukprot:XP_001388688.1 hypothetical protein ANI_1_328014 [Aspergillus niger CBS 513.88]
MAIWPFGRKNKRHTIQLDAPAVADVQSSQEPRHSFDDGKLGRLSRKHSKRQKNRHAQPVEVVPSFLHDASHPTSSPVVQYPPPTSHSEQPTPMKENRVPVSRAGQHSDAYTTYSTMSHEQPSLSRSASLLKSKRNENGPAVLKKKLSKRKAYEIAREREIRMLASAPIDIPRRPSPLPGEQFSIETRRANGAQSRRSDRHCSDTSLSMRDSAASSLSDIFESYTFKVNTFAAWTPRPVIRYVEAPRVSTAKSQRPSEPSIRKDKTPAYATHNEHSRSKKRVDKLADDLDAGALRELLERDRRRRERKQLEDQARLHRKLQRAAEQQRQAEAEAEADAVPQEPSSEAEDTSLAPRGRPGAESRAVSDRSKEYAPRTNETNAFLGGNSSGSWLRGASKDTDRRGRESVDSVHVIGNIDDSSIREPKLVMRRSFAPSQDMGMSGSSLSHSPSRRELYSPTSSQLYGIGRESTSDISRTIDSDRRLSDHGSGRVNTLTSIFRRGSSRLKRSYRERFHERSPEHSNPSHESFFKVQTQSSGPPPSFVTAPRTFLGSGTIKRSQSKFTEHFGDEPLSPPDSRLQSPDIPEVLDEFEREDEMSDINMGTQYPIPSSGSEPQDIPRNPHHSWTGDSWEGDPDNLPLSQSLASIDSEGSWMSGQFLRRISQKKASNPLRTSLSSSRNIMEEGHEGSSNGDDVPVSEPLVRFGTNQDEGLKSGPDVAGASPDKDSPMDSVPEQAEETWHDQIARRPVLVTPAIRPKSNEGLLKNVQSFCAEEEFSPIEEHSAEFELETSDNHGNGRSN